MSWEFLDAQEKARTEEAILRGCPPEPKLTMGDLLNQAVRNINQHDPNVIATVPAGEAEVKS